MNAQSNQCVGATLSADIAVPDHAIEQRFYARVLATGDDPLWREDLMNNRGTPIIGLGAQSPEHAHLPLQWMPHIQVADVAGSTRRALELGGRELMHGKDDAGASQWAVLADPNGAAFGIIPVVPAEMLPPADASGGPAGRIAWLDLTVSDAAATRDFYRQVIGWSAHEVEMREASEPCADFIMSDADENPAAGIRRARGVNLGLPAAWLISLPVADLAESLRRVRDEGGEVIRSTTDPDGQPTQAVIKDPVGACLALVAGAAAP